MPNNANSIFLAKTSTPRPFDVVVGSGSQMHVCCAAAVPSVTASKPGTFQGSLSFGGPLGEFVSGGRQLTLSNTGYKVTINQQGPGDLQVEFARGDTEYDANFSTGSNRRFVAQEYPHAQRYAMGDPGKPGLEISGDGRACNEIAGSFEVSDVEYHPNGTIAKFAATFEQWCDNSKVAARGSVSVASQ